MSTLLVDELYNGVTIDQPIKINQDLSVAHIRPWIYKHGTLPAGQFKLTILQGVTELQSRLIDFSDINTELPETYAHGSLSFNFDNLVLNVDEKNLETEYILRFEVINYINDTNGFIGMCRRYESKTYDIYGVGVIDNEAQNDMVEPFGLELFEYKLRR